MIYKRRVLNSSFLKINFIIFSLLWNNKKASWPWELNIKDSTAKSFLAERMWQVMKHDLFIWAFHGPPILGYWVRWGSRERSKPTSWTPTGLPLWLHTGWLRLWKMAASSSHWWPDGGFDFSDSRPRTPWLSNLLYHSRHSSHS